MIPHCLPDSGSPLCENSPYLASADVTPLTVAHAIAILIVLLLLNAFFVILEFALSKLRLPGPGEEGDAATQSARHAREMADHPDRYLAACQLGITVSSLLIGAVGAPFFSGLLRPVLSTLSFPEALIHGVAFVGAITVLSSLHFVFGEQIPKAIGVHHPWRTSVLGSGPLRLFRGIFFWALWLLNAVTHFLLKYAVRVEPVVGRRTIHTAEELQRLVEETGEAHEVTAKEREIAVNALELSELKVKDILTPRNEVVSMDIHKTFHENLDIALRTKHTRFPLVDEHLDKTLGLIHIKDLIAVFRNRDATPDLFHLKRPMIHVPETLALDELLKQFLANRAHMALVNDEFGGSLGLVMLDDVLDQIVGDIADEFDEETSLFRRVADGEFVVDATMPLHEFSDVIPDLELEHPEVSTVGGYVIGEMGHLPAVGETVEIEGYRAEVIAADERSIDEIRFTRLDDEENEPDASEEAPPSRASGEPGSESHRPALG